VLGALRQAVRLALCERVRLLFQGGEKLLTEFEAEGANR
jgi:hypothetical protein